MLSLVLAEPSLLARSCPGLFLNRTFLECVLTHACACEALQGPCLGIPTCVSLSPCGRRRGALARRTAGGIQEARATGCWGMATPRPQGTGWGSLPPGGVSSGLLPFPLLGPPCPACAGQRGHSTPAASHGGALAGWGSMCTNKEAAMCFQGRGCGESIFIICQKEMKHGRALSSASQTGMEDSAALGTSAQPQPAASASQEPHLAVLRPWCKGPVSVCSSLHLSAAWGVGVHPSLLLRLWGTRPANTRALSGHWMGIQQVLGWYTTDICLAHSR